MSSGSGEVKGMSVWGSSPRWWCVTSRSANIPMVGSGVCSGVAHVLLGGALSPPLVFRELSRGKCVGHSSRP